MTAETFLIKIFLQKAKECGNFESGASTIYFQYVVATLAAVKQKSPLKATSEL